MREQVWLVDRPYYLPDYRRAFGRRGFQTEMVPRAEIQTRLASAASKPAFVVDSQPVCPTHAILREAGVAIVGLPFDQWYHTARIALPPYQTLRADHLIFTLAPEQIEAYRASGYPHVEHLLFGVDVERFDHRPLGPEDAAKYRAEVAFIGESLRGHYPPDAFTQTLQDHPGDHALQNWLRDLARRIVPFDYRVPEILLAMERETGMAFGGTPGPTPKKETWCILAGIKLSESERLAVVRTLAQFDFALYGSDGWRAQLSGDPALRCYRGEADWASDLPCAIRGAPVNINVSKAMFLTGICPRVFETLACGRLLVSNPIPAILETFEEDQELVVYRSLAELADKVRYYLKHPDAAAQIARRGRAAVVARHSVDARVDRVVTVLEQRGIIRA